jgi:hypothetical protein
MRIAISTDGRQEGKTCPNSLWHSLYIWNRWISYEKPYTCR